MAMQVDSYPAGAGDLRWWEDPEDSEGPQPEPGWSPPRTVDILRNVHMLRKTHIKSPFHHRRYPYQFKTPEYYKYKSEPAENPQDEPKEAEAGPESAKPTINVELDPLPSTHTTLRDRFKEKSLRQRIYDGEVFFYEDYVEYNIARDYCRLFGRPFNVPRPDWGGQNFYFGEKIPDEKLENDEVEILRRETTKHLERLLQDTAGEQSETDALIMATGNLDEFKRSELIAGEIPTFFENSGSVVKRKPRKDRWVSFHNLKNYGLMIDSVTKCPLIHVQLQSALQTGWNPTIKGTVLLQPDLGGHGEPADPYAVSEEHMAKARAILADRSKKVEEPLPDITKLFKSKSYGINENCYTIGGGRYRI